MAVAISSAPAAELRRGDVVRGLGPVPSRPPGVHSRPEMITRLSGDIPADIRRAVEAGLKGWHRLLRFQTAMNFPTIEAAAIHLGAHQSALVHQFRRLERDIGAHLYHRSTPRQPMRPTQRGTALLAALARPDVQAAATASTPDTPARRQQRPAASAKRRPVKLPGGADGDLPRLNLR
jgi:hypothetical protein